jgi:hypothetical protein
MSACSFQFLNTRSTQGVTILSFFKGPCVAMLLWKFTSYAFWVIKWEIKALPPPPHTQTIYNSVFSKTGCSRKQSEFYKIYQFDALRNDLLRNFSRRPIFVFSRTREPFLRLRNFQLQRRRCCRLERFFEGDEAFLFSKVPTRGVVKFYTAGVVNHDRRIGSCCAANSSWLLEW